MAQPGAAPVDIQAALADIVRRGRMEEAPAALDRVLQSLREPARMLEKLDFGRRRDRE